MSLNTISLSSAVIVDLYQRSLVSGIATAMPQTPPLPFLGKAGKNILIVVASPDVPFLPDSELSFLTKILTACGLSLLDVAIVNWSQAPHHNVAAALAQLEAKALILFNLDAAEFGLPAETALYTISHLNGIPAVVAPPLQTIEATKEEKTKLWLALKQIFGL